MSLTFMSQSWPLPSEYTLGGYLPSSSAFGCKIWMCYEFFTSNFIDSSIIKSLLIYGKSIRK